MKKLLFTTLLVLFGAFLSAQTTMTSGNERPAHNVNMTLAGNASLISFNYEILHFAKPTFFFAFGLGLGYGQEFKVFRSSEEKSFLTLPHFITGNVGKGRSFFEFGVGGTLITADVSKQYYFYPIVGYRLLPMKKNKMYFRLFAEVPLNSLSNTDVVFSPVGLSVGFVFRCEMFDVECQYFSFLPYCSFLCSVQRNEPKKRRQNQSVFPP